MLISTPPQPAFLGRPDNVQVPWGYGLRAYEPGDYVKKPMKDCNGEEVLSGGNIPGSNKSPGSSLSCLSTAIPSHGYGGIGLLEAARDKSHSILRTAVKYHVCAFQIKRCAI
jgi:hypothetical protein